MSLKNLSRVILCLAAVASLASCSAKDSASGSSYDTSTAEVDGEVISGVATATDDSSGGGVVSMNRLQNHRGTLSQELKLLASESFESKAYATSCATAAKVKGQGGSCVSDVLTLDLSGCTGLYGTWTGSFTLTFSSGACTAAGTSGLVNLPTNDTMTLTSPNPGVTFASDTGYSVEVDSSSHGFNNPVSGGYTMECTGADCGDGRTVNIAGIHRQLINPLQTVILDHSFNTTTPFSISGTGANKQITAGTLVLQHNLAMFVATSQITQTLTFSSGCCQPTGGQITTTFSNGKTGSETVTFGPTCGVASVNGNSFSLGYCQ